MNILQKSIMAAAVCGLIACTAPPESSLSFVGTSETQLRSMLGTPDTIVAGAEGGTQFVYKRESVKVSKTGPRFRTVRLDCRTLFIVDDTGTVVSVRADGPRCG